MFSCWGDRKQCVPGGNQNHGLFSFLFYFGQVQILGTLHFHQEICSCLMNLASPHLLVVSLLLLKLHELFRCSSTLPVTFSMIFLKYLRKHSRGHISFLYLKKKYLYFFIFVIVFITLLGKHPEFDGHFKP